MPKAVIQGQVGLDTKGVDVKLAGLRQRSLGFAQRFGGVGGRMGSAFASGFAKFGPAGVVAAIGTGIAVAGGLIAKSAVKAYATVETITQQFKILLKDQGAAVAHLKDLREFAAGTPFELHGIAEASRHLINFSDGLLGGRDSLNLVGDAAAAMNQDIAAVAMWTGRAYSSIKAGRPFGEAAQRLQEMGILTGTTRNKMEAMAKSGADGAEIWALLVQEMKRYEGGMEGLAGTIEGKNSTIRDSWKNMMASLGEFFAPVWKRIQDGVIAVLGGITRAIDKTSTLVRTFKLWQDNDISWAEAKKQAEAEINAIIEKRKKDQLEMTDAAESDTARKAREKEAKAEEKARKKEETEAARALKAEMRPTTHLQKIGAGGMGPSDQLIKEHIRIARLQMEEMLVHGDRLTAIADNTKEGGLI